MELLTIITRTLQIFSSFVLIVIFFSFVTIKIKSRVNKNGMLIFSNPNEGKKAMQKEISITAINDSDTILDKGASSSLNAEIKNSDERKKIRIYAVYNPNSNPNFYLHNRLNWFRDFNWTKLVNHTKQY